MRDIDLKIKVALLSTTEGGMAHFVYNFSPLQQQYATDIMSIAARDILLQGFYICRCRGTGRRIPYKQVRRDDKKKKHTNKYTYPFLLCPEMHYFIVEGPTRFIKHEHKSIPAKGKP